MNTRTSHYREPSDAQVQAFGEGMRAFEQDRALVDNPYPETSILGNEWEDGYYAASAVRATAVGA